MCVCGCACVRVKCKCGLLEIMRDNWEIPLLGVCVCVFGFRIRSWVGIHGMDEYTEWVMCARTLLLV